MKTASENIQLNVLYLNSYISVCGGLLRNLCTTSACYLCSVFSFAVEIIICPSDSLRTVLLKTHKCEVHKRTCSNVRTKSWTHFWTKKWCLGCNFNCCSYLLGSALSTCIRCFSCQCSRDSFLCQHVFVKLYLLYRNWNPIYVDQKFLTSLISQERCFTFKREITLLPNWKFSLLFFPRIYVNQHLISL